MMDFTVHDRSTRLPGALSAVNGRRGGRRFCRPLIGGIELRLSGLDVPPGGGVSAALAHYEEELA